MRLVFLDFLREISREGASLKIIVQNVNIIYPNGNRPLTAFHCDIRELSVDPDFEQFQKHGVVVEYEDGWRSFKHGNFFWFWLGFLRRHL